MGAVEALDVALRRAISTADIRAKIPIPRFKGLPLGPKKEKISQS